MATMVIGTDVCDLPEWVPVPTNDSTISIINLVVAGSNVPFGIFAFLSNLAIIVTALKTCTLPSKAFQHSPMQPRHIRLPSWVGGPTVIFYMVDAFAKSSRLFVLLSETTYYSFLAIQDVSYCGVIAFLHGSNQPGSLLCLVPPFILSGKRHQIR